MRTFSKRQLAQRYGSSSEEAAHLLLQLQSHLRRCKEDAQALKRNDRWESAAQNTSVLMRQLHHRVATRDTLPCLMMAMRCFDAHWEVQMHG